MNILVGHTGFVGSNIADKFSFDGVFNSKNIQEAFGTKPELCVYSGVRAEKFLANNRPEDDLKLIDEAISNIKKINPSRLVLISTIDVFKNPLGVTEETAVDTENLHPYGLNRYLLETWVKNNVKNHHIIRLPGLFGKNIKKNFIYDFINFIPSMLNEKKFAELSAHSALIKKSYQKLDNGFYKCTAESSVEKKELRKEFEKQNFSALNFTDSRGIFQFYNLACLAGHIKTAIANEITLLHTAVEPLSIAELYHALTGKEFVNEIASMVPHYDFRSIHAEIFGGSAPYLFGKDKVLADIVSFVGSEKIKH